MKQVLHKQAFFERAGSGAPPNSSSMGVWCVHVKLCVWARGFCNELCVWLWYRLKLWRAARAWAPRCGILFTGHFTDSALVPKMSRVRTVCILCPDSMCITLSFPLIDAFLRSLLLHMIFLIPCKILIYHFLVTAANIPVTLMQPHNNAISDIIDGVVIRF